MASNNKNKNGYKTSKHHRDIVKEYDEKNTQSVRLKLNKKTDSDILQKLNNSSNMQGTIKNALRNKDSKKKNSKKDSSKKQKAKTKDKKSSKK
jgi:hypothetical protein